MSSASTTVDAHEPPRLIVSVTEIRRRLGSRIDLHRSIVAEGLALADVGVAVPDGADVVFDGGLESIHEGVVLSGSVAVPWTGVCRRCLKDLDGIAAIDVREVYETHPVDGETWPLLQDHIDIGPLLHDTALLALPLAPLCAEDCAGPAPADLPVRVAGDDPEGDVEDSDPPRDPRWAALDGLDL